MARHGVLVSVVSDRMYISLSDFGSDFMRSWVLFYTIVQHFIYILMGRVRKLFRLWRIYCELVCWISAIAGILISHWLSFFFFFVFFTTTDTTLVLIDLLLRFSMVGIIRP